MTVSEKLRLVQGLHSHAEMFGFKWDDDSDWTWHDVACKIADEVDAENAKLREELEQWHKLTAGIELPEYPITQFQPKDLERENAKLRELCADIYEMAYYEYPSAFETAFAERMRELGVEVEV